MSTLDRAFIKVYSPYRGAERDDALQPIRSGARPAQSVSVDSQSAAIAGAERRASVRPLSSFEAQKRAKPFRPALEVDSLIWPRECDMLVARNIDGWNALAAEVLSQAVQGDKLFIVTSRRRSEGRTATVACLARELSRHGVRVAMVDADFDKPELSRRVGVATEDGWDAALAGQVPLEEVVVASLSDGVALLPWKKNSPPWDLLRGPRAAMIFNTLRERFEVVLVDAGPSEGDPQGWQRGLAQTGPAVIYAIYDGRSTTTPQLEAYCALLEAARVTLSGLIENFAANDPSEELVESRG